MPILARYKWLYPIDWPQLSAAIRFGRAKGCCETCGRPHGKTIVHLRDGRWWDDAQQTWRNGRGGVLARMRPLAQILPATNILTTKVALATAHLDHDPANMVLLADGLAVRATDADGHVVPLQRKS